MTGVRGLAASAGRHRAASGSRWSGWRLYLRSRSVPGMLLGAAVVVGLAWWTADWLASRDFLGGADARIPVVVAAPLLGAVLVSAGLGGADEELDRTTAVRWRCFRAAYVVLAFLLLAAGLAVTGLWEPRVYGAYELVRNTGGFVGMVAIGAVVLGARLAWAPAFGYAAVAFLAAPRPLRPSTAWWTWLVQPSSVALASWVAVGLLVSGFALYVRFGARVIRHDEPV